MDLIHHLHTGLRTAAGLGKLSLESISVLCVLCVAQGLVISLPPAFNNLFRTDRSISRPLSVRWNSATGWHLALEFQLGAGIVATTVNPSLQALGELAAEAGLVKKMREATATRGLENYELS